MIQLRIVTALLTVLVVTSAIGASTGTVAAAETAMEISSVEISPNEPTTGESVTFETTVSNLETSNGTGEITAIYLREGGEDLNEYGRVRNVGTVDPGEQTSVRMSVSFDSPGEKRVIVNVGVEDADGNHETLQYPVYVDVEESNVRAQLSANTTGDRTDVELTNYGNVNLTNVGIAASIDGDEFERKYTHDVAQGSSQTATFDTRDYSGENVTFTATYEAQDGTRTTSLTKQIKGNIAGEVALTGVEATLNGNSVTVQGDAANVGDTDTRSVLLSIPETEDVSPIAPSGEYFIGTIEASEFATFELTADAPPDITSLPVESTYIVDGDRQTTTQEIDLESAQSSIETNDAAGNSGDQGPSGGPPGAGGLPLTGIGVVLGVVLLGAIGFTVYRWRTA